MSDFEYDIEDDFEGEVEYDGYDDELGTLPSASVRNAIIERLKESFKMNGSNEALFNYTLDTVFCIVMSAVSSKIERETEIFDSSISFIGFEKDDLEFLSPYNVSVSFCSESGFSETHSSREVMVPSIGISESVSNYELFEMFAVESALVCLAHIYCEGNEEMVSKESQHPEINDNGYRVFKFKVIPAI